MFITEKKWSANLKILKMKTYDDKRNNPLSSYNNLELMQLTKYINI